jgi:hypothetical protein
MLPSMTGLPGVEWIEAGLRDLALGQESIPALLVSIGAPRLSLAGLAIPRTIPDPEHGLYRALALEQGNHAHSGYNAMIRRLVSFERSLECVT